MAKLSPANPANPERSNKGNPYGIHRVMDARVQLPQSAEQLDNQLPIFSNEILISVERLNIDAASFVQMEQETKGNPKKIAEIILQNCRTRGKQHNRVTGSGGILIGSVKQIGSEYKGPLKLKVGDRVASMISLTLTPLHLDRIQDVLLESHQVIGSGHAILFQSSIAARLPDDIPERVAMAGLDVAGAPAYADALCRKGKTLVVIGGGGKAGMLSIAAGRRKMGKQGRIIAIEAFPRAVADLKELGMCDAVLELDATDPVAVRSGVEAATRGKMGDIVVNVASVPNTETSSILSAKSNGKVVFFSMATSFTQVALGAEGIATSATLIFGNGYYPNHIPCTLNLLRKSKKLRQIFERRYNS